MREPRFEQLMEAIYAPEVQPARHVRVRVADQFDALIHFDQTRPLEPLDTSGTM
jgi:erythromycin esterase-like protein